VVMVIVAGESHRVTKQHPVIGSEATDRPGPCSVFHACTVHMHAFESLALPTTSPCADLILPL
jgi:hypothetical protein